MSTFPRWLVAAFGGIVLAMVAAGVWFYQSQYQSLRQETAVNLQTITQLKADQIVQWRKERLADASLYSQSPLVTEMVAKWMGTPDPKETAALLAQFRLTSACQHYQDVALVDANGQVRLSLSGRHGPLPGEVARALAAALRDRQPVLSELHAVPGESPPQLEVIAPLLAKSAGAAGCCGAIILQCDAGEFLYPLIRSWPVRTPGAETLLVRRDGDSVLYLNELRHQPDAALKLRLPLSRTDLPAVAAVGGGSGMFYGKDYRGIPVVAVSKAIPGSTWFMVTKEDAAEAFASWRFRSVLILALIFGAVIAAGVMVARAWQRTARFGQYSRSLIEASLDPLVTISPEGKITDVNEASAQATGVPRETLIGTDFLDYFTDPAKAREGYRKVFSEGLVRDYPLAIRHLSGRITEVLYNATVYRDGPGRVLGVFAAARDITQRKEAEAQVHKLNAELEQRVRERTAELTAANQELEAFCYSVSHDLRAPLRHVGGFADLLVKAGGPGLQDKGRHYLEEILDSVRQMGCLIDDLLLFSRMGRAQMRLETVDLEQLVHDARKQLEPEGHGRELRWRLNSLPKVQADGPLLRQVMLNLLANALKFTRPRQPAEIEIGCDGSSPEETVVFVRDNGVGFDMAYAGNLFAVFQRLHSDEEFEGTGIGLATVRRIVARHGGRTWAEGKLNAGATFYFSLPKNPKST